METELLEVGETYGRGYKRALAFAKRAVKNTPLEPEYLIEAMLRRMVDTRTLVHVVGGEAYKFLDCIAPYPDPDETKVMITVPMPRDHHLSLMRDREWDMMRDFQSMLEHERVASDMPITQYVPLDPKRIMAGGFRFWTLTRTAEWQHKVGLKTPKTATEHKIVRKPRTMHTPEQVLPRRSLFAAKD